jgi:hypothetical protein
LLRSAICGCRAGVEISGALSAPLIASPCAYLGRIANPLFSEPRAVKLDFARARLFAPAAPNNADNATMPAHRCEHRQAARAAGQDRSTNRLRPPTERRYFSCDEIEPNFVFSLVPRPFTTAMIATEIPAAIRPYSIAVAPDSSCRKLLSIAACRLCKHASINLPLNRTKKRLEGAP